MWSHAPHPVGLPGGASDEGLQQSRMPARQCPQLGSLPRKSWLLPQPSSAFISHTLSPALLQWTVAEMFGAAFPPLMRVSIGKPTVLVGPNCPTLTRFPMAWSPQAWPGLPAAAPLGLGAVLPIGGCRDRAAVSQSSFSFAAAARKGQSPALSTPRAAPVLYRGVN